MGRNALRKKLNRLTDNYDVEPITSSKKISAKENLPSHVEELTSPGNSITFDVVLFFSIR